MHIESVPNRLSHPTILLRESYRADGKVKKRTIADLTDWPEALVEGLRTLLRGGVALARPEEALMHLHGARDPGRAAALTMVPNPVLSVPEPCFL
jgi:hypothetical protein